jgi:hypothetical protein
MITISLDNTADIIVSKRYNGTIQTLINRHREVGHYNFLYRHLNGYHIYIGDVEVTNRILIHNKKLKREVLSVLYKYKQGKLDSEWYQTK